MRNKPRCGLFTCALTILGATVITTTLLLLNYGEKQYHVQRGPASRQAALRDARDAAAALVDAVTRPPAPGREPLGRCKRGGKCHTAPTSLFRARR